MRPNDTADTTRLQSIDALRGAVMVLMAIDHVRVYAGVPPGGPDPAVFFTRWVTHFCAPLFVFLAGTAAWFHGRRLGTPALSRFLLVRGAWLILLELSVIRLAWTFNADFASYLLAGVIWVIGWSMIGLGLLIWLPVKAVAVFGVGVVVTHNAWGPLLAPLTEGPSAWLWQILYFGGPIGATPLVVLYSLIPWLGVMAAGYAFGLVMQLPTGERRTWCLRLGFGAIALFVGLRYFELYGDYPWRRATESMPALLAFLNTSKYPASLLFLLMTLGPGVAVIPWLERAQGRIIRALVLFGRVPLFYYLLHIPLIHVSAIAVTTVRNPGDMAWLFQNHPMGNGPAPDGYRWSLWLLYAVTVGNVMVLYAACRWYERVKRAHPSHPVLRFL